MSINNDEISKKKKRKKNKNKSKKNKNKGKETDKVNSVDLDNNA